MAFSARIDVHQHFVPPAWAQAMHSRGLTSGMWATPAWSAEEAIAMMDRQGIASGVLSVTAPGVHLDHDDAATARILARAVNEHGAETIRNHPERFGHFASLPLPDVNGALDETAHALDDLGADGVVLMSNAHGHYLGDPAFEPIWAELDRRAATVFIHPTQPPMPLLPSTPAPLADYVFDTTRTALNLVLNGVMSRYANVRIILSHGGGFLPYAAYRFAGLTSTVVEPDRATEDLLDDFKRFYFDTALSASPSSLPALFAFAEPDHILYGSDWPFAPEDAGRYYNHFLETYPHLTSGQAGAINRGNAELLVPRLAR